MFTGLVAAVGTIRSVEAAGGTDDARLMVEAPAGFLDGAQIGASIACAGCCLTAVAIDGTGFTVQVSAETLSLTTLGAWRVGTRVNLERSLRVGDELGGHLVSGHVDGLGALEEMAAATGSIRLRFSVPRTLAPFIARKGSIAVDGVSLTVNDVGAASFEVNIIPHTAAHTTLGTLRAGDAVNIEIDTLARYVARLAETAVMREAGPGRPMLP